jgi:hypothetical protein
LQAGASLIPRAQSNTFKMAAADEQKPKRQPRQKPPEGAKPKGTHGGARPGSGRPKSAFTRLKEKAVSDALIWYASPEITTAMITYALNGDTTLLKHLDERIHGRIGDTAPLCVRLEEMQENLPAGFDPAVLFATLQERLVGASGEGEWLTSDDKRARKVGVTTLEKFAARGDKQAAAILAKGAGPEPMLSLPEQAATMTPEQVRETMMARYLGAWPWLPREEIERMVDAVVQRG